MKIKRFFDWREVLGFARPDDWSGHVGAAHYPGQRQTRHAYTALLGFCVEAVQPGEGIYVPELKIRLRAHGHAGTIGVIAVQSVFSREQSPGKRAERRIAKPLVAADGKQFAL